MFHLIEIDLFFKSKNRYLKEIIKDKKNVKSGIFTQIGHVEAKKKTVVLLAEDNPVNQQVMIELLHKLNIECEVARNGEEAVQCFERKNYDLIFMDNEMPIMNGIDATIKIREIERQREIEREIGENVRPAIQIVGLTGHASTENKSECLEAGMDFLLFKPLRLRDLRKLLIDLGFLTPSE